MIIIITTMTAIPLITPLAVMTMLSKELEVASGGEVGVVIVVVIIVVSYSVVVVATIVD